MTPPTAALRALLDGEHVDIRDRVREGLSRAGNALLLDYRTHQRRLLRPLAATYALHFAQDRLRDHLHEVFTARDEGEAADRRRRELETLAAGVKAVATGTPPPRSRSAARPAAAPATCARAASPR